MPETFQFSSINYYSPGICPVGYTTACHSLDLIGTLSETVVTCCPTPYAYNSLPNLGAYPWQYTFGCQSAFGSGDVFPTAVFASGTAHVSTGPTTALEGAANALSVQIRYQSTDFQSLIPAPTPTPTSTTTIASISATVGAGSGGDHVISPGVVVGIGVGSAAVALFLADAFVLCFGP
ncbi:uncharacterized protein K444DRAFT_54564 [Hyaloscypha bicolor E]|uniref:Uncharacterized protein n=1 Tax=Hyaloscypha bicolor E TaxID=1095630 RepID=A0A2J6SZA8_9HELO|nr:uncharacterized protein K444DRAFT_54564 [Hyaloscypha bicolor E]PMD56121.1 hypothetical protein K444DRAFT_54564 [Hyaloscypha bicolor E]